MKKEETTAVNLQLSKAEDYFIKKMDIPPAEISIIKKQLAPGISDGELLYCLEMAKNYDLSLIRKEVYIVSRRSQVNGMWVEKFEPMIGRKGARIIARKKGMNMPPRTHCVIKKIPMLKNGKWILEEDLVAVAELTILENGNEVTYSQEANYSSFVQTKKDGSVSKFWHSMPLVMLQKVAEFQLIDFMYGLDGYMNYDAGMLEDETPFAKVESEISENANKEYIDVEEISPIIKEKENINVEKKQAEIQESLFPQDPGF